MAVTLYLIHYWELLLWVKWACKSRWKWCKREEVDSEAESQGCAFTYPWNGFSLYEVPRLSDCPSRESVSRLYSVFLTTLQWQRGHSAPLGLKNNFLIIEQVLDKVLTVRNMDPRYFLGELPPNSLPTTTAIKYSFLFFFNHFTQWSSGSRSHYTVVFYCWS